MELYFKVTTWEKLEIAEKHEELVLEAIKNGEITDSDGVLNFVREKFGNDNGVEYLDTTDCSKDQVSLEDNGGDATIEVYKNSETIFTNEIKE